MFVFVWWWFPRHYRKGVEDDMDLMDSERAGRDATHVGLEGKQGGTTAEPARPKTSEEHVAIARETIRRGHNPAAI